MIESFAIKVGSPDEWASAFGQFFTNNPTIKWANVLDIKYTAIDGLTTGQIIYFTPPIN